MDTARTGRCIALFPGAFRPPHQAHLAGVLELASRTDVNEVVVIISNRSRELGATGMALDAEVARKIWSVYLRPVDKARIEVAEHTAVEHVRSFVVRAKVGDTLLLCIGEQDLDKGDDRFDRIQREASELGVVARVCSVKTGSIQTRASDMRLNLARGEQGRSGFLEGLPTHLSEEQQLRVWSLCRSGRRPVDELAIANMERLLTHRGIGPVARITPIDARRYGAFKVRLLDGRRLRVKHAGDRPNEAFPGEPSSWKPRRRLSAESRALEILDDRTFRSLALPRVEWFDSRTWTLVLSEECAGGPSPRVDAFLPELAQAAGRGLAELHTTSRGSPPLRKDAEADRAHWKRVLDLRTTALAATRPASTQRQLHRLAQESAHAIGHQILKLDFRPEQVRLRGDGSIALCNFELASSIGDPAMDLGALLGMLLWQALRVGQEPAGRSAMEQSIEAYRCSSPDGWAQAAPRVARFTGAAILRELDRARLAPSHPLGARIEASARLLLDSLEIPGGRSQGP